MLRHATGEERLVIGERLHSGDEILLGIGLEQIGAGSGREQFADQSVAVVHGEDQDLRLGEPGTELPRCLDTVHQRQRIVDDGDVGLGLDRLGNRVLAVLGLGHDLPSRVRLEDRTQARAHYFVVVGNEYASHESPRGRCKLAGAGRPSIHPQHRSDTLMNGGNIRIMEIPENRQAKTLILTSAVCCNSAISSTHPWTAWNAAASAHFAAASQGLPQPLFR